MEAIHATTMYPSTVADETSKRTPQPDDVRGVVAAYPLADDPKICRAPGDATAAPGASKTESAPANAGGCAASGRGSSPHGTASSLGALVVLASLLRRRRPAP